MLRWKKIIFRSAVMRVKGFVAILVALLALKLPGNFLEVAADKDILDKTNEGISTGSSLVEVLKLGKSEESKAFKRLTKMSAYLGAVGGVISLVSAFLPEEESAELQFMREKFEEVSQKLDTALEKLDQLPNLIGLMVEKAKFSPYEQQIIYGYKQLQTYVKEMQLIKCKTEKECKKLKSRVIARYLKSFDVKSAMLAIVNGATGTTSVFSKSLLDVIKTTHKCDVPKIQGFANGILRLAYKAQQAILAYEKLAGTKHSITLSLKDWLKLVYQLRIKTANTVLECYRNIKHHILNDIKDAKYQEGDNSVQRSSTIAAELKKKMEQKYSWLDWVAVVYKDEGSKYHCVRNELGNAWSSGKRNVVAMPVEKSGTFSGLRNKVENAIRSALYFRKVPRYACQLHARIMEALSARGLRNYISNSVTLVYDRYHHVVGAGKQSTYSNLYLHKLVYGYQIDLIKLFSRYRREDKPKHFNARFVFTLNSIERVANKPCNDKERCNGNGICQTRPFSAETYCICKENYHGEKCETRSTEELAATTDALLDVTFQLPTMTDIQFDIKDLREFVGVGFGSILASIKRLEATVIKTSESIKKEMANGFDMANLVTQYSDTIFDIEYYDNQLQVASRYSANITEVKKMEKRIAEKVLGVDRIEYWVYKIDSLIRGREAAVGSHKPLLVLFIEKYGKKSCTQEYKKAVDNCWRRMFLLQERGFLLWARARELMGLGSKEIIKKYKERTKQQVYILRHQKTCSYVVPGSDNIRCTKGMLLPAGVVLNNKCMKGYYNTGLPNASCENRVASCSRDCVWGEWSQFTQCVCGNNQYAYRTRLIAKERAGQGKLCTGPSMFSNRCFKKCCSNEFDCKNDKQHRCIHSSLACNYINNCGNRLDEQKCNEIHYYGFAEGFHLDRFSKRKYFYPKVSCNHGGVLSFFNLERKERDEPYRMVYICRKLFNERDVCHFSGLHEVTGFNFNCGNGFLKEFQLVADDGDFKSYYKCCRPRSRYGNLKCVQGKSKFAGAKDFLKAKVVCFGRYFLSSFRKVYSTDRTQAQYHYQCCKIA